VAHPLWECNIIAMIDLRQFETDIGKNTLPPRQGSTRGPQYTGTQLADQKKKDKEELYRKNWEQFKNDSDITPEFILADSASKTMSGKISTFNDTWSKARMDAPNHELSEEQQLQMRSEKKQIEMEQQKAVSDMQKYQAMKKTVENNPDYDSATFQKWEQEYLQTGKFDYTKPPLAPINLTGYIATEADKSFKGEVNYKDGRARLNPDDPADAKKIDEFIKSITLINPRAVESAQREWDSLGLEGQKPFLEDINNDKVIDANDIDNNAIMRYIIQKPEYRDQVVGFKENRPKAATTTSTTTFKTGETATPQKNQNGDYTLQQGVNAYGTTFGTLLNLGRKSFTSDPQTIETYVDLKTNERKKLGEATRFEVVAYSPDKDLVVVKLVDDTSILWSGDVIGLDASRYADLLRSKPFYLDRESLLKQYGTVQKASQSITTKPTKLRYNYVTGKLEPIPE
jgi:hypothetical protein